MSENHKLLHELRSVCREHGINQGKAVLAFELYMELCEVHKIWNVEHHFHEKLNTFYLTGKPNKEDGVSNVYVPLPMDETFNVGFIDELQASLSPINKSLILVFRDQDSSSTHYRVTQGLKKPDSPIAAQRKKIQEKKNNQLQKYLTKWRKKLYSNALDDKNKVIHLD